ncbi:MAG: 30S ribosomal protein S16 [Planctomycetota bacterium]
MATVIRLTRRGRMHAPFFRIGVFDSRTRRDGAPIENVGYYNPIARGEEVPLKLEIERLKYWLEVGATPSETVQSFLKKAGIAIETRTARTERNRRRSQKRLASEKKTGRIHGKAKQKAKAKAKSERRAARKAAAAS